MPVFGLNPLFKFEFKIIMNSKDIMYSIHNRDDSENLKKLQEPKSLLRQERMKKNLGNQDLHYDLEEGFEPVTAKQIEATGNQKQLSENQLQTIRDSSQTTTQAKRESSNALNKNLRKSIKEGIQEYDEITIRYNQILTNLVISNTVDSSLVKSVSNLLNDLKSIQFRTRGRKFKFMHN